MVTINVIILKVNSIDANSTDATIAKQGKSQSETIGKLQVHIR